MDYYDRHRETMNERYQTRQDAAHAEAVEKALRDRIDELEDEVMCLHAELIAATARECQCRG
jgi:hypothetical protein